MNKTIGILIGVGILLGVVSIPVSTQAIKTDDLSSARLGNAAI